MGDFDPLRAAQNMIRRHGLQAQAVAMEHLSEQRQVGDATGLEHWQAIHAAICELRRTQPSLQANPR